MPAFGNSVKGWRERRGIFVVARAGDLHGVGEASPLPGYLDADLGELERELRDLDTFEVDPDDPLASVPSMTHSTSQFAIETAIVDMVGRARGVEACQVLAERPAERCQVYPVISEATAEFQRCKVKIGRDLETELDLISALRTAGVAVRVDANRSLPARDFIATLERLAALGVELCEEPTELGAMLAARELPLPIALDETLQADDGSERARALAADGKLGALVIKPAAVGGLRRALALAELADELGCQIIISHMLDGPIALAAACELALAVDRGTPHGLAAHPGLAAYPPISVPQLSETGIHRHGQPGLGVAWP